MTSVVKSRLVTDALITLLDTLSFPIGDGEAPANAGDQYAVVYPLPDLESDGPANDIDSDVQHVYQVTAVGTTREQAEWVADEVRETILIGAITIAGRSVMQRRALSGGSIERDDDLSTPLFYKTPLFQIWTTPA